MAPRRGTCRSRRLNHVRACTELIGYLTRFSATFETPRTTMARIPELHPPRDRAILGTCCIPWTADYQLDEPLFRRSIQADIEHGTKYLYLFGTAGEGHSVSDRQF